MYYRQFLNLKNIDICNLLDGPQNFLPVVKQTKEVILNLLPFLPRHCPVKVGKYYGYNMSVSNNLGEKIYSSISPSMFPNGDYRNIYKFYTNDDPVGASVLYVHRIYDVDNVDNVMKKKK